MQDTEQKSLGVSVVYCEKATIQDDERPSLIGVFSPARIETIEHYPFTVTTLGMYVSVRIILSEEIKAHGCTLKVMVNGISIMDHPFRAEDIAVLTDENVSDVFSIAGFIPVENLHIAEPTTVELHLYDWQENLLYRSNPLYISSVAPAA